MKRRNFKIRYEYKMVGRKYARTVSCKMVELTLECGHTAERKRWQKRVECVFCLSCPRRDQ